MTKVQETALYITLIIAILSCIFSMAAVVGIDEQNKEKEATEKQEALIRKILMEEGKI